MTPGLWARDGFRNFRSNRLVNLKGDQLVPLKPALLSETSWTLAGRISLASLVVSQIRLPIECRLF